MSFDAKLQSILSKHDDLSKKALDPSAMSSADYVKVTKEIASLDDIVAMIKNYQKCQADFKAAEEMLKDPEFKAMAEEELQELKKQLPALEHEIKITLLPKDEADEKNAILEVRAGAGGDEAGLFAAEVFRMYLRYAERRGWKYEVVSTTESGIGAYKEATANIIGKGVFAKLKFESGVHRVQRVPATEASGRIHTSTATVAVMAEVEEVDIEIKESDLKIDVFRASGAGGQHVNTTESAVRITHIPTGAIAACQDERSQHKNKATAMKWLRARIYDAERMKKDLAYAAERKSQVGTGDRSERIRTYNFPQGRVTDHRIGLTAHNIDEIMDGGKGLDEIINALIQEDQASKLAAVSE
jgi:peptide chain release factor 1